MHKNNHNYNVSREKYSMHLYLMKEENSPIKTYATIYMHYQFEIFWNYYYFYYHYYCFWCEVYEISHIWTAVVDESKEWSSQ